MNVSYVALAESIMITGMLIASQYVVLRAGIFSVASTGLALVGAYTFAILTVTYHVAGPVSFLAAVIAASICSWGLGLLVEKLRGTYQAIATLAFVLVLQQVTLIWEPLTGGAFGIVGIPVWANAASLIPLFVVGIVLIAMLDHSRLGLQQAASRMGEQAAASCGVDVARVRLVAMVVSGVMAGAAGACMAGNQFSIDPTSFGFDLVVITLAGAVIGGFRWFLGPIVGALIVQSLPILLGGFATYQTIVTGMLTLIVLAVAPQGLTSLRVRKSSVLGADLILGSSERGSRPRRLEPPSSSDGAIDHSVGGELALEAEGVGRSFGGVRAVGDVSFALVPGEVCGLIGPNGAGKSTLLNLLAGVLRLDQGTICVASRRVDELPAHEVSRAGVARTFQTVKLFGEMSVFDNVLVSAATASASRRALRRAKEDVSQVLELAGVQSLASQIAATLPYTDQRRVEIARALVANPSVLLLDEPAAGMTAPEAQELGELITRIAASGVAVLVVDHNVSWILDLCNRILVQSSGELIAMGRPDEIRRNDRVKAAYLG